MDFDALADFVAAVEAGGVTAGAKRRNQPKQSVSRRLVMLEHSLGVRLFDRTTRAFRLTPEGALLYERAGRTLADIEEMRRMLADRAAAPSGLLRVSAPVLLGHTLMGEVAARVLKANPNMRLDIALSDARVDLVEEGFDAAIRVGPNADSSLVSRLVAKAETIIVGAPDLIERVGAPDEPAALASLPCVIFGEGLESREWTLTDGPHTVKVTVTGLLCAGAIKMCIDAAVAGLGFVSAPAFCVRQLLGEKALVRVLPAWRSGVFDINLVYPSKRLLSPRLRVFIDEVSEVFGRTAF